MHPPTMKPIMQIRTLKNTSSIDLSLDFVVMVQEPKDEKKEDTAAAAAAKEENKDKATTQVEERKEPFLVFEELYPVSFALRPDYTRYYYY